MSLLLHDRAQTLLMSYPPPDHRSIASEWQTTSLLVPKESRESDGAGLRRPYGDTLRQTPSPRLPHFVPERLTAVKKILIFPPGLVLSSSPRHELWNQVWQMVGKS